MENALDTVVRRPLQLDDVPPAQPDHLVLIHFAVM